MEKPIAIYCPILLSASVYRLSSVHRYVQLREICAVYPIATHVDRCYVTHGQRRVS